MAKKKEETLMDAAKDTVKLGIVTGVGFGVLGGVGALSPHSGPAMQAAGAGLGLVSVGRMAKTGMTLADSFIPKNPTKKQKALMDRLFD